MFDERALDARQCVNRSECAPGYYCVEGYCQTACKEDYHCSLEGTGYICVNGNCILSAEDDTFDSDIERDHRDLEVHPEYDTLDIHETTDSTEPDEISETTDIDVDDSSEETCEQERCNGVDDDCDGDVDENISVTCYTGPENSADVGICHSGELLCQDGEFSECLNEQIPQSESEADQETLCDNLDNDCDGDVDEFCPCSNGDSKACYTGPQGTEGVGICKSGTQECVDNHWGECTNSTPPEVETCANMGTDNDCDDSLDNIEDLDGECENTTHQGVCRAGTYQCVDEQLVCFPSIQPGSQQEVCNGLDDDCDGIEDNGLHELICGVGICTHSQESCQDGVPQTCDPLQGAQEEACNGQDDDCDGETDEGCDCNPSTYIPVDTSCGQGACASQGRTRCVSGEIIDTCEPDDPDTESCNGVDDDCDGIPDGSEGLTRQCGITDAGECEFGTETCTDAGTWTGCDAIFPQDEVCNGLDDNCNNQIDDIGEVPCFEDNNACGAGIIECVESSSVCSTEYWGADFAGQELFCGQPVDGSTIGGENNRNYYNSIVDAYNGPEAVYAFVADADYTVQVNVTNMSEPVDVFVLRSCGGNYLVGGPDGGYEDSWEFTVQQGSLYYLVIDDMFGGQGTFQIGLVCMPR